MKPSSRRDFCVRLGSVLALGPLGHAAPVGLSMERVREAPWRVSGPDGSSLPSSVRLERVWSGSRCQAKLTNSGASSVRVGEVTLFSLEHSLPADTGLYGESFQMLSQTAGTLGKPEDLGMSEARHYRIPQPAGAIELTGLLTLEPPGGPSTMLAFSSCHRFAGRFAVFPGRIDVTIDGEGLELKPGERWTLEEFVFEQGEDREALLDRLAARIVEQHPVNLPPRPPAGWCSWYCFGPRVTAADVIANLDAIAKQMPALRYVQLDDGYQAAMGDWLAAGAAFGGGVRELLAQIRARGFEPAIWVAPFIAEAGSRVFGEHPDWFVCDADGKPLPSNRVTFGGWRRGPWYALDGTNPEVQRHFEALFRTMRNEWGCTYFKLDANFWGAMHGGHHFDRRATRIEAYRRGMEAVRRGAGDAFLLGCNHPVWGSFGLIDGSRASNDIGRKWERIRDCSRETLARNWQNGRLWWNDPDAIVLTGNLSEDEIRFHATATLASGGLMLSGDDLTRLPAARRAMLGKLLPPAGAAARFRNLEATTGEIPLDGARAVCLLNAYDRPEAASVTLETRSRVSDYWSGKALGIGERGTMALAELPPHSGRVLIVKRGEHAFDVAAFDRARVLRQAEKFLAEKPETVTATSSPRSAGGPHDYFSEGDYWWPDAKNPGGPYIQRDGMSNPDNFDGHRRALLRLSVQMPALAAAWKITGDKRYAAHAAAHLRAWFLDPATRMNPSLQYAQAIHGRVSGRGTGIIDTIHLVEVTRGALALEDSDALTEGEREGIRAWFGEYVEWLTTHPYGHAERDAKNNHATCWAMQTGAFAVFCGNRAVADDCAVRYKTILLPRQMASDGGFPLELRRTKPYGYSIFNLEAMATLCQVLATPLDNLWRFELPDGRSIRRGVEYLYPFLADKSKWTHAPDVMYFNVWPMRQASLLFAGFEFDDEAYLRLWRKLPADSNVEEAVRNFFVRQPALWV